MADPIGTLRPIVQKLDRLAAAIDRIVQIGLILLCGGIFLVLLAQVMLAQVMLRYVIFIPLSWVEELATYLMAFLTLWGASVLLRSGGHLEVDTLLHYVPRWLRLLLVAITLVMMMVFAALLIRAGWAYALMGSRELSDSGTFVVFWPRLAIVTGGVFLFLQVSVLLLKNLVGLTPEPQRPE